MEKKTEDIRLPDTGRKVEDEVPTGNEVRNKIIAVLMDGQPEDEKRTQLITDIIGRLNAQDFVQLFNAHKEFLYE